MKLLLKQELILDNAHYDGITVLTMGLPSFVKGFSCSATGTAFIFIGEQLFFCNSGDDLVLSRYYSGICNKSQGFIEKIALQYSMKNIGL